MKKQNKEKALIVEDQFIEANNLRMILSKAGYEVCGIARSVSSALEIIDKEAPDIVLLDIYLKGPATGVDLAHTLRERGIPFIYLSANCNKTTLDAAKATGPYGFLVKPFRDQDVLVTLEIARYLHENSLESLRRLDKAKTRKKHELLEEKGYSEGMHDFFGIIGSNARLQTVIKHLKIVAPAETSVLILGESGTGKERIAELVHHFSKRKTQTLVKVDCATLPENLIESTLFGHERGAFTGAFEKKIGKFEQADGGSIFLDEIGELSHDLQVKLLRVLQEKEIERVGGHTTIPVDVRIIAATNRNLENEVAEGRFRLDLYYRLNAFPLHLPSLRDRKDDIPLLADHFLNFYLEKLNKAKLSFSRPALDALTRYDWPGNIRELAHVIEKAVLLCEGTEIEAIQLTQHSVALTGNKIQTLEEIEREHIKAVLQICNGKISGPGGAAEILGINVSTLNARIKKLGIKKVNSFNS